jgi:3-deoxy-D-manno-octulosonic-acid transferase
MSQALSLIIYNLCLPFGLLAMAPGALVKMRRRGGKWGDFSQRLGRYDEALMTALKSLPRAGGRFWIHAVSVGEVEIAKKLASRLLAAHADCGIVLTTTTPTGRELTRKFAENHASRVIAVYSPIDLPFVVARVVRAFDPTHLVLVEAEVWPNLVSACSRAGIPISLVNARLSSRSEGRYRAFGFLVRPVFAMLDQVLVQETDDVSRWAALGVERSRIAHTGSVKFDPDGVTTSDSRLAAFRALLQKAGWSESAPVLLAASTHPGEELEIAKVFQQLQPVIPDLKLLIVPRHVERTPEVVDQLRSIGLQPALRTDLETTSVGSAVVIVNTTGELRAWQHLASVVIIGKSFLAKGGQNPAEALMASKPVVFGPHMENFAALATHLRRHDGAVAVAGFAELQSVCARLLQERSYAQRIALSGNSALTEHEGATQRTVDRLLALTPRK